MDSGTRFRSPATLVPPGLSAAIAVAIAVAMLLAVVATLAGGYAVMFVLPDAPETARETMVDIQADTPGVEWLQRKPACAS